LTITYPRTDIMAYCGYQPDAVPLRLQSRQEISRTASGVTIGKDLGPAIWMGEFVTQPLALDDMVDFEAILNSLDGVVRQFEAGDLRRPYPKAHPTGSFNETAYLSAVQAGGGAIKINGTDIGFTVSRGDYLAFDYPDGRRALHQAMETVTSVSGGETSYFEVRPRLIMPSVALSPSITVRFKNPTGLFCLVPGSVQSQMTGGEHGVVRFQAVQSF